MSEELRKVFDTDNLYDIIGVDRAATAAQIKKAYYKSAMKLHPDKNPSTDAKQKFQALGVVYGVLSDPEKRSLYDETGDIDSEVSNEREFQEWYDYFRTLFPPVTAAKIDKFGAEYKGSAEERADVLDAYERYEGDMSKVQDCIMFAETVTDLGRLCDIVEAAAAAGDIKLTTAFRKTRPTAAQLARKPRARAGAAKGKSQRKAAAAPDIDALAAQIRGRQAAGASAFGALLAKYGGDGPDPMGDISEADFAAAGARLKQQKRQKRSHKK